MSNAIRLADDIVRCRWATTEPELSYHDTEWGFPLVENNALFEKLTLESFQSGLSWRTILVKRESFREAFANFEIARVALFDQADIERLLIDAGIVRHRGKIEAAVNNARRAEEMVEAEGSLGVFFWRYERSDHAAGERASIELAKELKRRGWRFVGPTTVYAFMQSIGLVNDHAADCGIRARVESARGSFTLPA